MIGTERINDERSTLLLIIYPEGIGDQHWKGSMIDDQRFCPLLIWGARGPQTFRVQHGVATSITETSWPNFGAWSGVLGTENNSHFSNAPHHILPYLSWTTLQDENLVIRTLSCLYQTNLSHWIDALGNISIQQFSWSNLVKHLEHLDFQRRKFDLQNWISWHYAQTTRYKKQKICTSSITILPTWLVMIKWV